MVTLKQAKEQGLKRYVGKACLRHGSRAERYTSNSMCISCETERYWNDPEKHRKSGRERYWADPEKGRAKAQTWRKNNRDKVRESKRRYRETNPEKVRKQKQNDYAKNYEKYHERGHKRYWTNPEEYRERQRYYNKTNPAMLKASNANRTARKYGAPGIIAEQDVCSKWHSQQHKCFYCGTKFDRLNDAELDHIVAFAKGGTNFPSNICIACHDCNQSKRAKQLAAFCSLPNNCSNIHTED